MRIVDFRKIVPAVLAAGLGLLAADCSTKSDDASVWIRNYNGSAAVGDFLRISVDPAAQTLTYDNLTTDTSGTLSYSVEPDGSYAFDDPSGNYIAAYEVPGVGLLFELEKAGPNADTPSIALGIVEETITVDLIKDKKFNIMQFRTASGGMEIGYVNIDSSGNIISQGYWPYGNFTGAPEGDINGSPDEVSFSSDLFTPGPDNKYLILSDEGETDYIFGTASGMFVVDNPNGSIFALERQPTKNFNPDWAGTYRAVAYMKENAMTGEGNVETGTVAIKSASISVGSDGSLVVTDEDGNEVVSTVLEPIADRPDLVGPGRLEDPCNGMFTFRIVDGTVTQDVFVSFIDGAMLFASFSGDSSRNGEYSYFYGMALEQGT